MGLEVHRPESDPKWDGEKYAGNVLAMDSVKTGISAAQEHLKRARTCFEAKEWYACAQALRSFATTARSAASSANETADRLERTEPPFHCEF